MVILCTPIRYSDCENGGRLWLWKPQIILQTMAQAPAGSLIVYIDVGFIFVKDVYLICSSTSVIMM